MNEDKYLELNFTDYSPADVDRRDFLKISGGGLFILFTIGRTGTLLAQNRRVQVSEDFNAYLRIGEDGRVTCFTGKIEMGQGVITSLAQTIADELDVDLDSVDMVLGDTDLCPYDRGTWGSMTTRFFGPALRNASAAARQILFQMAAEQLKKPQRELAVTNGVIFEKSNKNNKVSYAQLTQGKRIEKKLTENVILKEPSDYKIINKPVNRRDALQKVTGKAIYTSDMHIPGMMHAKILRPPAHGAELLSADVSEAQKVKGAEIIRDGDFIAVLHRYPDIAEEALAKIKAEYSPSKSTLDDKNIFDHLLKMGPHVEVVEEGGDPQAAGKKSDKVVESTFYDGYVAHAPIETHSAIAKIEGNKATIWAASQTPFGVRTSIADMLGFKEEDVRVITPFVGGGFGGKGKYVQAREAARLAKLSGKPVQVAFSREEEFFYDSFRPAAVVKIKSGVSKEGKINLWDFHTYFAGSRGAALFYDIPNFMTAAHGSSYRNDPETHPFDTGAWRAPGNNTNTFARESQIEIMAAKAGIDPLEFRLKNLKDKKMINLLNVAGQKFNWAGRKSSNGIGKGIACGTDAGTYVVTMAEVQVDKKSGNVVVKKVLCVQDMGLCINPEGAQIQMEGCITMGLGYALSEDIRFKNGKIFDLNFDSYDLPKFSDLPEIETIIIDDINSDPQGGGEPAIVTMGAVIANAIFDAVGVRLYQMPMTPERVLNAIETS